MHATLEMPTYTPTQEELLRRAMPFAGEPIGESQEISWTPSEVRCGIPTAVVGLSWAAFPQNKDIQGNQLYIPHSVFQVTEPGKDYPVGATFSVSSNVDSRGGNGQAINWQIINAAANVGVDIRPRYDSIYVHLENLTAGIVIAKALHNLRSDREFKASYGGA